MSGGGGGAGRNEPRPEERPKTSYVVHAQAGLIADAKGVKIAGTRSEGARLLLSQSWS